MLHNMSAKALFCQSSLLELFQPTSYYIGNQTSGLYTWYFYKLYINVERGKISLKLLLRLGFWLAEQRTHGIGFKWKAMWKFYNSIFTLKYVKITLKHLLRRLVSFLTEQRTHEIGFKRIATWVRIPIFNDVVGNSMSCYVHSRSLFEQS